MIKITKEAYDQGAKDVTDTLRALFDYCPNDTAATAAIRKFLREH